MPDLTFRRAFPDELARAAWVCAPLVPLKPGEGPLHGFVAVKDSPVERIVGAAFWRLAAEDDRPPTKAGAFEWKMLPGYSGTDEEREFLKALRREVLDDHEDRCGVLRTLSWLRRGSPRTRLLEDITFRESEWRTSYTAWFSHCRERLETGASACVLPDHLSIVAPEARHFEVLKRLLCGASRALEPSELAYGFQTASTREPSLFDPRCSGLVFEGDRLAGACLAVPSGGRLSLNALGADTQTTCLRLFQHALERATEMGDLEKVSFFTDSREVDGPFGWLARDFPVDKGPEWVRLEMGGEGT